MEKNNNPTELELRTRKIHCIVNWYHYFTIYYLLDIARIHHASPYLIPVDKSNELCNTLSDKKKNRNKRLPVRLVDREHSHEWRIDMRS